MSLGSEFNPPSKRDLILFECDSVLSALTISGGVDCPLFELMKIFRAEPGFEIKVFSSNPDATAFSFFEACLLLTGDGLYFGYVYEAREFENYEVSAVYAPNRSHGIAAKYYEDSEDVEKIGRDVKKLRAVVGETVQAIEGGRASPTFQ